MHARILSLLALALACVLLAGCASPPTETTTPTPTTLPATTIPITIPTTTPPSLEPGPTVTTPPGLDTIMTVERNPISAYPDIIVTYNGGSGNLLLQWLDITVTRSDGIVETAQINRPPSGTIPMGATRTLAGSNGSDRVEITAYYYGDPYKIYDDLVPPTSRS